LVLSRRRAVSFDRQVRQEADNLCFAHLPGMLTPMKSYEPLNPPYVGLPCCIAQMLKSNALPYYI
jgi:hypothetical protein